MCRRSCGRVRRVCKERVLDHGERRGGERDWGHCSEFESVRVVGGGHASLWPPIPDVRRAKRSKPSLSPGRGSSSSLV